MSLLDIANATMLRDAAQKTKNGETIDAFNDFAAAMEDRYGVQLMDFQEFDAANPGKKPSGFLGRLAKWTAYTALAFGSVAALLGGIDLVTGSTILTDIVSSIGQPGSAALSKLVVTGAALPVLGAAFDDEAPNLQVTQLEKYGKYLENAEKTLQQAEARGVIQAKEQDPLLSLEEQIALKTQQSGTHFQDKVRESRLEAALLERG